MLERILVFALMLPTAAQGQPDWLKAESQHFEIHYRPGLAGELPRVTRAAERAYVSITGRLNFSFPKKVPLVLFSPSGTMSREQVVSYAVSDRVAPQQPHRSRIVLPLGDGDVPLDVLISHELTHLLVGEIILPEAPGDGAVPRWVHEGIATYLAGGWTGDHQRVMREMVAAGSVPALSQVAGDGGFANPRVNEALGHVAFEYIESRWGPASIRRFVDALIIPRVSRTYDAVFELTPAEFDAAFRQYAQRRFGSASRGYSSRNGASLPPSCLGTRFQDGQDVHQQAVRHPHDSLTAGN
jgi:hypothetical protein